LGKKREKIETVVSAARRACHHAFWIATNAPSTDVGTKGGEEKESQSKRRGGRGAAGSEHYYYILSFLF